MGWRNLSDNCCWARGGGGGGEGGRGGRQFGKGVKANRGMNGMTLGGAEGSHRVEE